MFFFLSLTLVYAVVREKWHPIEIVVRPQIQNYVKFNLLSILNRLVIKNCLN